MSLLRGMFKTPALWSSLFSNKLLSGYIKCGRYLSIGNRLQYSVKPTLPPNVPDWVHSCIQLARYDKPTGTWLLYIPCTWSIALAAPYGHLPDLGMLTLFGLGSVLMRGAGCTINDMWDQGFDKHVERTKGRPLASGAVTNLNALLFLGAQLSASLCVLLQLNTYSIALGFAAMVPVITYPLFKRITYWPQVVLGLTLNCGVWIGYSAIIGSCSAPVCTPLYLGAVLWTTIYDTIYSSQVREIFVGVLFKIDRKTSMTFNWGALLGYSAVIGHIDPLVALPLYLAGINWTLVYDTFYAHQDIEDDLRIGVKSTAILFREKTKPYLSLFHAGMSACLLTLGTNIDASWIYYTGCTMTMTHLAYLIYMTDLKNPESCLSTFKANKTTGLMLFATIVLEKLFAV